jgi:hypothetical protein
VFLVAAAAVERAGADELVAEVHMHELADFEEAYGGAPIAAADVDGEPLVADDPVVPDLAGDRVGRIERRLVLGEFELAQARGRCRPGEVALGWGEVSDPLVGALLVVVAPEAVEQKLQVLEVGGGPLVREPLLERAVEALELAERLRVGGRGVDQFDPASASLRSNSTVIPSRRPVKLEWLSESSWRGRL